MTQFFDSLGWALLHSLWQGAGFMALVVVFRALTKNSAPSLRYMVQLMCLFGCLAAFLITFGLYQSGSQSALGLAPLMSGQSAGANWTEGAGLITQGSSGFVLTPLSLPQLAAAWAPIFGMLWCLGFAMMATRYFAAYRLTQKLRTRGITQVSGFWKNRFRAMALSTGVSQSVQLYISAHVSGPITLGFLKPIVLVPAGFLTGLPRDQVEAILLHELAHIRRYDYLVNLLQTGIKTVLFFHPAVHFISAKIDIDREQACDDVAVAQSDNAQALVRGLAALRLQMSAEGLAMAAKGSGKDTPLFDRLKRLAETPTRQAPRSAQHILMPVLATLLLGGIYASATSVANAHLESELVLAGKYESPNANSENYHFETARINGRDITVKITEDNRRWAHIDGSWVDVDLEPNSVDRLPKGMPQMPKFSGKMTSTEGNVDRQLFETKIDQFEVDIDYFEAEIERYLEANTDMNEREKERLENRIERQIEREADRIERLEDRMEDQKEREWHEARIEAEMERHETRKAAAKAAAKTPARNDLHNNYTQLREVLYDYATADGYVTSRNEPMKFTYVNNNWHVNGTPVARNIEDKYCEAFTSAGIKKAGTTKVEVKPGSTHVSSQSKGRKSKRVTIGRHVHKNGEIHDPQAAPAMPMPPAPPIVSAPKPLPNYQASQAYPQGQGMNYTTASSGSIQPQFQWPVAQPNITAKFGNPDKSWTKNHTGLDLAGNWGAPVFASADGIVHFVTTEPKWGHRVIINHAGGYQSVYAHLNGFSVKRGQTVRAGDVIAGIGDTGKADKPHLHFEIHKDGKAVDPAQFTP